MASIGRGGLKAPDMVMQNTVWKYTWIHRLQENSAAKWGYLIRKKLEKFGGLEYFLQCNYDLKKSNIRLSEFWEEVFMAHQQINNDYVINKVNRKKVKTEKRSNRKKVKNPEKRSNDRGNTTNFY